MHRRNLIRGFIALGVCPICAQTARAASAHWGYGGSGGPGHWADLDTRNFACSAGRQQSPIDIAGTVKADIPRIDISWLKGGGRMVNNGHTIQINMGNLWAACLRRTGWRHRHPYTPARICLIRD